MEFVLIILKKNHVHFERDFIKKQVRETNYLLVKID
jgi:hypothetical protein